MDEISQQAKRLILTQGPPGIGKTALVEQFIKGAAKERYALILRARCSPFETIPFNAVDGIMDDFGQFIEYSVSKFHCDIAPDKMNSLIQLFPLFKNVFREQQPFSNPDPQKEGLRTEAINCIAEILNNITGVRPIVLFIDDFQWADNDSIYFIIELFKLLKTKGILLLLNSRDDETATYQLLLELMPKNVIRQEAAKTINLVPLDAAESRQLAMGFLNCRKGDIDRVVKESDGIPYFLETLALFTSERSQKKENKQLEETILSGFIQYRLSQLPGDARSILEVATVAGQPLDSETAFRALKIKKDKLKLVMILIKRRLLRYVVKNGKPAFQVYHRLIEETILESLSQTQREAYNLSLETAAAW